MLILGHGLPVALTDHIDRSPDKLLLRGRVGHVHSWIWAENDRLPTVVYVKFPGALWKLNGIDEPGVYPIQPGAAGVVPGQEPASPKFSRSSAGNCH